MIDGFVPPPGTGFQVKQQDMSRAEILDEMRRNGLYDRTRIATWV